MADGTMGSPLVAAARRLHRWAGFLVALLQWIFSLVLPTVCSWEAGNRPCSARPNSAHVSARLIKDGLRVLTYGEVARARRLPPRGRGGEVETCAVCLGELRRQDRVSLPRNCRHVYHRRCLDRWIDHDEQGTCPLCRAPLLPPPSGSPPSSPPPQAREQEQRCSWAVEQLLYLFGDDLLPASPSPPPASLSSSHCSH